MSLRNYVLTNPNMLDEIGAALFANESAPKSFPPPVGIAAAILEAPAEGVLVDFPAGLVTVTAAGAARAEEEDAGGN